MDQYYDNLNEGLDEDEFSAQVQNNSVNTDLQQHTFFSEEELQERKNRALRYNLEEIKQYQPYSENEEEKQKVDRAKRFGFDYTSSNPQANVGLKHERREWPKDIQRSGSAIYLYGIDQLNQDQIWSYFEEYSPKDIQMINESSCLINFEDPNQCKYAIFHKGKPVTSDHIEDFTNEQRQEVIKYEWHRGPDFALSNTLNLPLVYRMAATKDVKQIQGRGSGFTPYRQLRKRMQRNNRNGVQKRQSFNPKLIRDYDQPFRQTIHFSSELSLANLQGNAIKDHGIDDLRQLLAQKQDPTDIQATNSLSTDNKDKSNIKGNVQGHRDSSISKVKQKATIFSTFDQLYSNPDQANGQAQRVNSKQVQQALKKSSNLTKKSKQLLIQQFKKDNVTQNNKKLIEQQNQKVNENYKDSIEVGLEAVEFDVEMDVME